MTDLLAKSTTLSSMSVIRSTFTNAPAVGSVVTLTIPGLMKVNGAATASFVTTMSACLR